MASLSNSRDFSHTLGKGVYSFDFIVRVEVVKRSNFLFFKPARKTVLGEPLINAKLSRRPNSKTPSSSPLTLSGTRQISNCIKFKRKKEFNRILFQCENKICLWRKIILLFRTFFMGKDTVPLLLTPISIFGGPAYFCPFTCVSFLMVSRSRGTNPIPLPACPIPFPGWWKGSTLYPPSILYPPLSINWDKTHFWLILRYYYFVIIYGDSNSKPSLFAHKTYTFTNWAKNVK